MMGDSFYVGKLYFPLEKIFYSCFFLFVSRTLLELVAQRDESTSEALRKAQRPEGEREV